MRASSPVRIIRTAAGVQHPLVWVRTRPPHRVMIRSTRPLRETRVTRLHKGTGMADDQHYDVVIIGTGAGGGTLGHRLATSGLKVLWLERGAFLPRERDNWETQAVFVRGKYLAPEVWYDGHGREFQPEVNYYVGGNTKFYGAALFRLRPEDFGELRHEGGISPAWPISYDDLEPYYSQAEHLYLVHGQHGEDPSEGHASAQYAHPPVSHEPRIQQLNDDLEKLGLHPFHLPVGVNLQEAEPGRPTRASACIRCDRVDGFPCLLNAKSDAQVICVDPALSRDNVTLVTGAHVQRLETDSSGRTVTGVVTTLDDGSETTFTGDCGGRGLRGGELGRPAAEVSRGPPPRRARQQLGSGRPALHATQQHRPDGCLAGAQPHPVPEDAGAERLVPRRRRLGVPSRRHPDAGQVRRRGDPRAGASLGRAAVSRNALRGAGSPCRRLLALR